MHKFLVLLLLAVFITSIVSISFAGAQENITANNTNLSTATLTGTESNKKELLTETTVETKEQKFRVGPTVRLRPLNSEINKSADGIVETFLYNPKLNDVSLEADISVDVPSDVYIYAEEGGMSGGAGTVTGHFSVPPGSSRTIAIHIRGGKTGTFPVHFNAIYWPSNNKEEWNPVSLDSSFEVKEPSSTQTPTPTPTPDPTDISGLGVASLVMILMMVFFLGRK